MSRFRASIGVVLAFAVIFAMVPDASAHRGEQSYLYVDIGEGLGIRLQMPIEDLEKAFDIDFGDSNSEQAQVAEQNADFLRQYASEHVEIGTPGLTWPIVPTTVRRLDGPPYVEVAFDVDHGDTVPAEIQVTLDPFFDEIDDRDALLLVANDLERGVIENEAEHLVRFTPDEPTLIVNFGDASQWRNFTASVATGVDHIRTGPDHMLFVVALLLTSVVVWRGQWEPVEEFGRSLLRIAKVLSMFTLAHSVTFTLSGLGLVPQPGPKVTETIIALSIAATALHNLKPIFRNREWVIAFAFGLFHGFGFASLVQDIEVSTKTQLISLLGRNLGIELGQLLVVLLIFPGLYLLRATRWYRPFFVIGSVGLIAVSLGWAYERLSENDSFVSKLVDQIAQFPRVLLLIAVFTLVAAAANRLDGDNASPSSDADSDSGSDSRGQAADFELV